ncbi:HlyC/CorC family transporter [Drancourtella massiliensis]|uniref:HlyC/CorC family transporter n=1 Tax=Drancourtella massiliensis TaxID=1632013 RepID=A0ABS2EEA7_9FIRM|nr:MULTISPECIES: hemolysin family protein [Drancourtella]MBM6743202.1 HlyC/CorC family transporter [Drancourtella massiliensis]OUN71406.1 hemolysin [Drancourtella sp. An57]OUQ47739.1 hemolysin [Drancourtella sp. An12]
MNSILPQLLLQVILIFLNAFFAAAEIAVISLNASKLRKSAEDGDKTCARLLKLVEEPSGFLSTIQIGITLAGFLGSAFAADNFSGYLVDWVYKDLGFHSLPVSVLDTLSVIVITIILSYFTLIFGELVPKRIAMQKSFAVAKFVYRVVSFVALIMKPAVAFLSLSTNLVLKMFGMKTEAEEETVTEDEIRLMVELGEENGSIDSDEKEWIQNVLEFNDTIVRNCMTHESEIIAISADATDEEITQLITESGTSRYPVYQNDLHDIIGVLNARTFLLSRANGEKTNIRKLLRPAYFIPETVHASTLFRDMQKQKLHIAIVVDEYGDTSGIVTLEDLVEEIFGNIYDEFDENEPAEIEQLKENLWRVTGTADVDDIAKELDIDLPESSDYTTLGGMVFSNLKTIPKDGTTVDLDVGDIHIHVDAISRRRIQSALVSKVEKEPEEE